MEYTGTDLTPCIVIDQLITIHYFEYTRDFIYKGESHDFWEFLYVDKGTIDVYDGSEWHTLSKGQMIFHQPMEFHALRANGRTAPSLIVISFVTVSPAMDLFRSRILSI